jgi:hypothetical protein
MVTNITALDEKIANFPSPKITNLSVDEIHALREYHYDLMCILTDDEKAEYERRERATANAVFSKLRKMRTANIALSDKGEPNGK